MKKLFIVLVMFAAMSANAQWVQMSNGITNSSVVCLTYSGTNLFAGTFGGGVFLSTNNGTNWTQTAIYQCVNDIAVSGNNILAGTGYNGVWFTTNNGMNWTQTTLNNKYVYSLAVSGNNIFAGSDSSIYRSTNSGANWTETVLNNQIVLSFAVSGNNIFAGTNLFGVYVTTNNGTSWTQTALNNLSVSSLAVSGNIIFAGTSGYGVYLTTNNGTSWTQGGLNYQYVYSLAVSGDNIIAGTGNNGVFLSTNNGTNWLQKNQGFSVIPAVFALLITNNYVFAGTFYNSLWRCSLSEITSIQNISTETPGKYSLSQNYPNPFNSMCNVQFSMSNAGNVKLVVYDIMGREVQTLVNEKLSAGTYEVKFDGSMLNSGVYFYRLVVSHGGSSTDGFTETKKMILIK